MTSDIVKRGNSGKRGDFTIFSLSMQVLMVSYLYFNFVISIGENAVVEFGLPNSSLHIARVYSMNEICRRKNILT